MNLKIENKWLTQEKLIGIICGSVSLFFLILIIIIGIYRKINFNMNSINEEEEESPSDGNFQQTNVNTFYIYQTTNNELDNWI